MPQQQLNQRQMMDVQLWAFWYSIVCHRKATEGDTLSLFLIERFFWHISFIGVWTVSIIAHFTSDLRPWKLLSFKIKALLRNFFSQRRVLYIKRHFFPSQAAQTSADSKKKIALKANLVEMDLLPGTWVIGFEALTFGLHSEIKKTDFLTVDLRRKDFLFRS